MGKVRLFLIGFVGILYSAQLGNSYSGGAPDAVCSTMIPGHSVSPQKGPSPYTIKLSSTNVKGGETVDVTLGTSGPPFAGFFAIGTKANSELVPVGSMKAGGVQGDAQEIQPVPCKTGKGITHKNSEPKSSVTFTWEVPNEEGDYVLLASFVKDYSTFWVKQSSPILHITKDAGKADKEDSEAQLSPKVGPSEAVKAKLVNFYENCGKTKGCFGIPSGCVKGETCEMMTTWRVEGGHYRFQIAGALPEGTTNEGHVSMGLSFDNKMGQDSVVGCVYKDDAVRPGSYYNLPNTKQNSQFSDHYLGLLEKNGFFLEGWVFCEFSREPVFNQPELGRVFNLAEDHYHILLARAPTMGTYKNKETNTTLPKLGYHGSDIGASSEETAMIENRILGANANLFVQLHGAVMVIAWVMTSSLGIFVARYYKQTHTDFNPFNKAFWFVLHVGSMFLTLGLTFLGVIFIVVEVGGISDIKEIPSPAGRAHPILGFILTGICCLQLTIGLLRPHPGTPNRPIFNWVHWTAGNVGHIVGVACIFLAAELTKSGVQNVQKGFPWLLTVGLFVLFHVLMHGTLSLHTVWADKQMNAGNKLRGISMGPMKPSKPEEAPGTGLRTFLLLLYIVGILSFGITLITLMVKGNA